VGENGKNSRARKMAKAYECVEFGSTKASPSCDLTTTRFFFFSPFGLDALLSALHLDVVSSVPVLDLSTCPPFTLTWYTHLDMIRRSLPSQRGFVSASRNDLTPSIEVNSQNTEPLNFLSSSSLRMRTALMWPYFAKNCSRRTCKSGVSSPKPFYEYRIMSMHHPNDSWVTLACEKRSGTYSIHAPLICPSKCGLLGFSCPAYKLPR
jgi:hypothetical protein